MPFRFTCIVPWICLTWIVAGSVCLVFSSTSPVFAAEVRHEADTSDLEDRLARLIAALGADHFATRERAEMELRRLGLFAFDALHEAQHHHDIEVALRARHLVRSMNIQWTREGDPAAVYRILEGYGEQPVVDRKSRIDRLATLVPPRLDSQRPEPLEAEAGPKRRDQSTGVTEQDVLRSLARIVRFEPEDRLSKYASLRILQWGLPHDEQVSQERVATITAAMRFSRRTAAQWLIAYAQTLVEPEAALPMWQQLTRAELEGIDHYPHRNHRDITRDLLRWHAELLDQLGHEEEALAATRRTLNLVDGSREQILDTIDWLMFRQAWPQVGELAERYANIFSQDAMLLYRLAESQQEQGLQELAERTAREAFELRPERLEDHELASYALQQRGLFDWAEREYRFFIEHESAESLRGVEVRRRLAEMLHDIQRDHDAAKVYDEVVQTLLERPETRKVMESRFGYNLGSFQSRMHYFYSIHYGQQGDHARQREHLELGFEADSTDADLLIAIYRYPGADERWHDQTSSHLREAVAT
jgi:tetratricopeptide (TPR) repeat protein